MSGNILIRSTSASGELTGAETSERLTFRPDLQGLRAVAILLVILAHAGVPFLLGGFVGVDVFFVLSGYLITGLLLREYMQNGRIALTRFYARRLKRLLPALVVMIAVMAIAASWLLSDFEASTQLAAAPYATTWTSNLYFLFSTVDYFDELAARDLFLHTWSLGVEEQFYLLWPFLLILLTRPIANRRHTALGLVCLASLSLSLYLSSRWPHAAFYLMPSRIWQFALGALVYVVFTGERQLAPLTTRIFLVAGLSMIAGSAIGLHPNVVYPGLWALIPSLGAALTIAAGRGELLSTPVLVWLGDRSYSWYLWHWPMLMLGFALGFEGQPVPTLGLILLSLLAAIISYRYVELPFWKGRANRATPRLIVLASALAMVLTASLLLSALRPPALSDAPVDPSFAWRTDIPIIYRKRCDAWYENARVEPCQFGNPEAPRTVVLLGDSIMAQWFSMVPAIFQEPEWRIVVLTKSSCAMVDEDYFYGRVGGIYTVCTEWRNAVLEEIEQRNPDVVIVGSATSYSFTGRQWEEGSARVLMRLSAAADFVFLVPGTPSLDFDGPGCVARNLAADGTINRIACVATDRMRDVETVTQYLKRAAVQFANVRILDLTDIVCPDGDCAAVSNEGVVVFRDSQHLRDSFVRENIPVIRERIMALGAQSATPANQSADL